MNVLHFIPSLNIGGIESMSVRLLEQDFPSLEYKAVYFEGYSKELLEAIPTNSQRRLTVFHDKGFIARFYFLVKLIRDLPAEDVVILSTWRSLKVFFIFKLLAKNNRIVVFHHRTFPAHFIDKISRKIFYRFVKFHFCDSQATCGQLPANITKSVVRPFFKAEFGTMTRSYNRFCIVGRIHEHRNLPRALKFFSELLFLMPDVSLDIIGPDSGAMNEIKNTIDSLGISDAVKIFDGLSPFETLGIYKNYDFIISTPLSEGMGMSIAEAMSAGVIPIVGAFGEPVEYCSKGGGFIFRSYEDEDLKVMAVEIADHRSLDLLTEMSTRASMITEIIEPCAVSLESQLLEIF